MIQAQRMNYFAVPGLLRKEKKVLTPNDVIDICCDVFDVTQEQIVSKSRLLKTVKCRQAAMYLIHKYNPMSFKSIGFLFGGRDHATAMHAIGTIKLLIETNDIFGQKTLQAEKLIFERYERV